MGDIISVKVTDSGGVYSFSCILKSKYGSNSTNTTEWNSYKPHDPEKRWIVPMIKEAVTEANADLARKAQSVTSINCQAIWPAGIKGRATGYLTFQIKEDSLKQ